MNKNQKYCCSICKFSTSSNYSLEVHFATRKHVSNFQEPEIDASQKFGCLNCNKHYKGASGLWKHAKICTGVIPVQDTVTNITEENAEVNNSIITQETNINQEILEAINNMNNHMKEQIKQSTELSKQSLKEVKELILDLKQNQQMVQTINHNSISNTTVNNTFNMNIFLNEKCSNAINFDEFINKITFSNTDKIIMIGDYVGGTGIILKRNLENIPVDKRPLHYLAGEDPHQQLIHIRQDNKWNMSTELNWMQQIHSDDDDLVENKNPIYYALQKIDDEKLKYLCTHYRMDPEYKIQHGRLNRETSRPDFKEKVYRKLIQMITLDTDKLDDIDKKSKIIM